MLCSADVTLRHANRVGIQPSNGGRGGKRHPSQSTAGRPLKIYTQKQMLGDPFGFRKGVSLER
ncbi:hypothetical protein B0T26DRAFT_729640 [Lasiosphaeria miniovina]|uniref:Uncharacterized protein n=1 Tax=Lasiosphaeria miniovina TaxID=1954250 RepID=A0AA39ZSV5_9PEZI|nr:uncharacterized protein B0T26DRAFT_729640 [Lasiosphaeria miniovina]KAK0703034.1 hypothetical protein B0T26DRAFT_729640 [Lasiosphaeria miniovina]